MCYLKYYVACTVDRFIAREDDSYDFFLMEGEHIADLLTTFPETIPAHVCDRLGITAENRCFDTVLRALRINSTPSTWNNRNIPFRQSLRVLPEESITA
jgi:hypothetical protein